MFVFLSCRKNFLRTQKQVRINHGKRVIYARAIEILLYEGKSISNQPNLFPVEIHLFFFDVIAL